MKNKDDRPGDAAELRRRAEKKVKADEAKTRKKLSPEEARQELHELRVHQIELEMRNEELRRAQAAEVREVTKKYRALFDGSSNPIAVYDRDGHLLMINSLGAENFGRPAAEIVGKSLKEFLPDSFEPLVERIRRVIDQKEPFRAEDLIKLPGGEERWFWSTLEPAKNANGSIYGVQVISYDITDRKRAEEALQRAHDQLERLVAERTEKLNRANEALRTELAERTRAEETLRESEEQLGAFMENAPDGVYLNDLAGNFLYGNRMTEAIIGYKRAEIIGKNMMELNLLAPEALAKASELLQANFKGRSTGPDELTLQKKDGRRIVVEINTSVAQRLGQPVVIGFVRDITERKQAEERLRESEKKYYEWFDFLPVPVYEMDMEANITAANRAIYEIFKGTEEDFKKGFNAWKLLSPEDVKKSARNIQRLLKGEQVEGTEYNFTRLDGSVLSAIVISSLIYRQGRPVGLRGAIIDITERKRAESQLNEQLAELQRWHDATLGRESRVLDLKREVNELLGIAGQPPRYSSVDSKDKKEE